MGHGQHRVSSVVLVRRVGRRRRRQQRARRRGAARTLRLVDGPDEVHLRTLSRLERKRVGQLVSEQVGSSGGGATAQMGSIRPGVGKPRL